MKLWNILIPASVIALWLIIGIAPSIFPATLGRAYLSPDIIGTHDHYFVRDPKGSWSEVIPMHTGIGMMPYISDVTDPAEIQQLEDTRNRRLKRAEDNRAPDRPKHES